GSGMVRRGIAVMGWGAAGAAISLSLVFGAFRIASTRLSDPATPIRVSTAPLISPSPSPARASSSTRPAHTTASGVPSSPEPVDSPDGGEHGGSEEPSHAAE